MRLAAERAEHVDGGGVPFGRLLPSHTRTIWAPPDS
jgi:hypothetical protein